MPIRTIDGSLHVDQVPVEELVDRVGTPLYAYSWTDISANYESLSARMSALKHRIHYAVKANSNLAILSRLANLGADFDVVSAGELERVIRAGGNPRNVVFSGVGKSAEEIAFALKSQVLAINVESVSEYSRIAEIAHALNLTASITFRVNPEIEVETHPYIATALQTSKFGMSSAEVVHCVSESLRDEAVQVTGIACHIGSQIFESDPYGQALDALISLADEMERLGVTLETLNIGGGFGVPYADEKNFEVDSFVNMLKDRLDGRDWTIAIEPGRSIVADAGVLVTKIEYLKHAESESRPNFAVVDGAMNDLIRPALYDAWHNVELVKTDTEVASRNWDIVGPVCESGDFLAKGRYLALQQGDLLAIRHAGAYGFVLSSNYNSRMRCPELLVDGDEVHVIRRRETLHDSLRLERIV